MSSTTDNLQLLILRHGKAEYSPDSWSDMERPLASRGLDDTLCAGKYLSALGVIPELIVSSPAIRALQTVEMVQQSFPRRVEHLIKDDLYLAPPKMICEVLRALPEGPGVVLLVGHNPGLEHLIWQLTPSVKNTPHLPTAGLARISLKMSGGWRRFGQAQAELVEFRHPLEFQAACRSGAQAASV